MTMFSSGKNYILVIIYFRDLTTCTHNRLEQANNTMSEKFCLKWNDFNANASTAFGRFRGKDFLEDVSLVGEDNHQIAAHKLVLSSCSEYFMNIFKNNKHSHPLICLEGISNLDLTNMLT